MSTVSTTGAGELGRLGEQAEHAVRSLNHLTRPGIGALTDPAEAAEVVGALSRAAAGLPQLTAQLASWAVSQERAGRLRVDAEAPCPDSAAAVSAATTALVQAAQCAHAAVRALDAAHQALSHLVTAAPAGSRRFHDSESQGWS